MAAALAAHLEQPTTLLAPCPATANLAVATARNLEIGSIIGTINCRKEKGVTINMATPCKVLTDVMVVKWTKFADFPSVSLVLQR